MCLGFQAIEAQLVSLGALLAATRHSQASDTIKGYRIILYDLVEDVMELHQTEQST